MRGIVLYLGRYIDEWDIVPVLASVEWTCSDPEWSQGPATAEVLPQGWVCTNKGSGGHFGLEQSDFSPLGNKRIASVLLRIKRNNTSRILGFISWDFERVALKSGAQWCGLLRGESLGSPYVTFAMWHNLCKCFGDLLLDKAGILRSGARDEPLPTGEEVWVELSTLSKTNLSPGAREACVWELRGAEECWAGGGRVKGGQ